MTSYYELKRRAYLDIDRLYKEGKTEEEILAKIMVSYGLGKKTVKERIEILDKIGA